MRYENNPRLAKWLAHLPDLASQRVFQIDDAEFAKHRNELRKQGIPEGEIFDHAVYVCLTYGKEASKRSTGISGISPDNSEIIPSLITVMGIHRDIRRILWALLAIIVLMLVLSVTGRAQGAAQNPTIATVVTDCNNLPVQFPASGNPAHIFIDSKGNICVGGAGLSGFVTLPVEFPNSYGPLTVQPGLPPIGLTTYAASTSGTLGATPTDIATISGNGTNTVVVSGVTVSCTQTTGGMAGVFLVKRSAADTGGVSTSPTVVPLDANNAVGVTAVVFYTSNPTLGATVGVIDQKKIMIPAITGTGANDHYVWKPGLGQTVNLRGTAQQLAVNFGGQTIGGAACAVSFQWVETLQF